MTKGRIASISPLILAGATLVRFASMIVIQYLSGASPAELWHRWLVQLVIGG